MITLASVAAAGLAVAGLIAVDRLPSMLLIRLAVLGLVLAAVAIAFVQAMNATKE